MPTAPTTVSKNPDGRDDAAWLLLLFTTTLILPLQWLDPFTWSLRGVAPVMSSVILLQMVGLFYSRFRPDRRIFAMVSGLQMMMLFSAVGASLSYMIAARAGPFWDARLAGWDRAMGLDWMGWLHWVNAHPPIATALNLAYRTLIPQMVAVILVLGLCSRLAALRTVIHAAMLAGLVIILMSGIMPAVAAYVYFGLDPEDYVNLRPAAAFVHMADIQGLRDGSLRLLDLGRMEGIITFPSYHGALAVIFCWGFSRATIPAARYAGMAVALMTLLATPVDGAHYFSDVIAGSLLAGISLCIARRTIHWTVRLRPGTPFRTATLSPT